MKKVLIAMLVSTVLLTGCGLFHSNKDWKGAKQENPLEVPPNLDRPDVSDALTIPSVNPSSDTGAASQAAPSQAKGKALVLKGGVDNAFKRVGMVLEHGSVGDVSHQDQATHTYQVQVPNGAQIAHKKGFFARHFSNVPHSDKGNADTSQSGTSTVSVQVSASSDGGSVVTADGNDAAVAKVMAALRARLGG